MNDSLVRNFERIQEDDEDTPRIPRYVTATLVVLGGACILFAGIALSGRRAQGDAKRPDPLSELVSKRKETAPASSGHPSGLKADEVTFPGILSDREHTTTALAAVRSSAPSADNAALPPPPPATDRLSVVPLPAQNLLEATPLVTKPRDALTKVAVEASDATKAEGGQAPSGHEGGYQLQISSFRSQSEANHFADQLRARSHRAHVTEARVPGRGTWYRVRVGPFASQRQASSYRTTFEQKEHVVPFIVAPALQN